MRSNQNRDNSLEKGQKLMEENDSLKNTIEWQILKRHDQI